MWKILSQLKLDQTHNLMIMWLFSTGWATTADNVITIMLSVFGLCPKCGHAGLLSMKMLPCRLLLQPHSSWLCGQTTHPALKTRLSDLPCPTNYHTTQPNTVLHAQLWHHIQLLNIPAANCRWMTVDLVKLNCGPSCLNINQLQLLLNIYITNVRSSLLLNK